MACFRLHSHVLHVETRSWEHHGTCDKCGLPINAVQAIKDEKQALFPCPCMQMCSLRLQLADLFHDLPLAHKIAVNQTGDLFSRKLVLRMSSIFFQRQTNDSYRFKQSLCQSLWLFSVWLVFTSNLNSQITWLKLRNLA